MTREQAINYLASSGMTDEQIAEIVTAIERTETHSCDCGKKEAHGDVISRQAAIDARRYTFGNDEFSLEAAYHDCKLVFDGITDDDSFQEADTGLILYYANEIIYALQEAIEGKDTNVLSSCSEFPNGSTLQQPCNKLATDTISRQTAIDARDNE